MKNGSLPNFVSNNVSSGVKWNQSTRPLRPSTVSHFAERISKYVQAVEHPSTTTKFVDFLRMIPKAAKQGWNRKLPDR